MSNQAAKLAKYLLEIKAVKLSPDQPFTWTSGIQSPVYCDNRLVLSFPEARTFVIDALAELAKKYFPQATNVAGIATAGIPHGALLAEKLGLPFCYVRPEPKKHGLKNQVEGQILPTDQVLMIEDLISTGKSSLAAVNAVKETGASVCGLLALFTYGFADAEIKFNEAQVPYYTISNFSSLLEVAVETGYLDKEKHEKVRTFIQNPSAYSA